MEGPGDETQVQDCGHGEGGDYGELEFVREGEETVA